MKIENQTDSTTNILMLDVPILLCLLGCLAIFAIVLIVLNWKELKEDFGRGYQPTGYAYGPLCHLLIGLSAVTIGVVALGAKISEIGEERGDKKSE